MQHYDNPMSQKEPDHDDLEEHRQRVRELIDEDRELLDALA